MKKGRVILATFLTGVTALVWATGAPWGVVAAAGGLAILAWILA